MKTYIVNERHIGDKSDPYEVGDERDLAANEAAHLVEAGVLTEKTDKKAAK